MYRYQILIEYVGTPFIGWQIQKKGKSVQKIIQLTLSKLLKQKIIFFFNNLHKINWIVFWIELPFFWICQPTNGVPTYDNSIK